MSAPSLVLWALDHHLSASDFERLCVDLLGRDGYWRIAPIGGTKDHGRDAEASYWRGKSAERLVVVFQFSTEANWERKLRRDAEKIAAHCKETEAMVFITSRTVTGEKQDKLAAEFKSKRGWRLTIHGREWLRVRLEEFHPDLARKYLHVELADTVCSVATQIEHFALDGPSAKELFRDQSPEQVRAAILESTRKEPNVAAHWKRLARIEEYLQNYQGALAAVNRAIDLETGSLELFNLRLLKGAVLAELGIDTQSRPLLIQAKEIFDYAVAKVHRAIDHYNLANVLTPLGDFEGAEKSYLRCVELEPTYAQAWKNLGTVYSHKEDYEKAMQCFEKALEIEPTLVEAHLSKANTLLLFLGQPEKAAAGFEHAYALEPHLDRRWRHARYWYGRALAVSGAWEQALAQVEIGLRDHPDELSLLNQKAAILSHLWPNHEDFVGLAYDFFAFRAQCIREDYAGLAELLKICQTRDTPTDAWRFLEMNLMCAPYSLRAMSEFAGVSLADWLAGLQAASLYQRFRKRRSIEDHCVTLHIHGLSPNSALVQPLTFALLPSFGVVARQIEARVSAKNTSDVSALFDALLQRVARLVAWFGADWLARKKPAGKEEQINLVTRGILLLPEVAVAEAARILGFLAGYFNVPADKIKTRKAHWSDLREEMTLHLLERVIEPWEMRK